MTGITITSGLSTLSTQHWELTVSSPNTVSSFPLQHTYSPIFPRLPACLFTLVSSSLPQLLKMFSDE